MKPLILLTFFCIFLSSCVKGNPNPELSDEIYQDLSRELDIVTKAIDTEEKNLASVKAERAVAVPQTGQIKFANKKVVDSEEHLNILNQQKIYFQIKLEQRLAEARSRYEESLKDGGRPWPDAKEAEEYKAIMKLQRDKIQWDATKGIIKKAAPVPRGTEKKAD